MITQLQKFLSHHRRWLIAVLLIVVVIPFVFTIGAAPGIGFGREGRRRHFFSISLNSDEDLLSWQRATALGLFFGGVDDVPLDRAMVARAAWENLAQELQIPDPRGRQLGDFVRTRPPFLDEAGHFSQERYGEFSRAVVEQGKKVENFVAKVMADDWRIHVVAETLAAADFSVPLEAQLQAQQLLTKWTLREAILPFATFHPDIPVNDDDLYYFFSTQRERYDIPEQICVDAIFFPEGAEKNAVEKFMDLLYAEGVTQKSSPWREVAEKCGGIVYALEPFSEDSQRTITEIPQEVLRTVWTLTDELFFGDPIDSSGGTYILLLRDRIEPVERQFEEVRELAEKHYIQRETVKMFAQYARDVRNKLMEQMNSGDDFATAALANGMALGNAQIFTMEARPEDLTAEQMATILLLNEGDISEFLLVKPDLHLWHVVAKEAPNEEMLPKIIDRIIRENSATSGQMVIPQIIEEQIADALKKL
ncbi:MAG: hypothetical protein LBC42_03255 [Puniceicoccales bacterium]|nr:hypothetical protein [Puniceicoccales bacterium]